jgi:hypothetical protein
VVVAPDTTSGQSPTLATGISKAKVVAVLKDTGTCIVVLIDGIHKAISREVPQSLLTLACVGGLDEFSRKKQRLSFTGSAEKRALSDIIIQQKELLKENEDELKQIKLNYDKLELKHEKYQLDSDNK